MDEAFGPLFMLAAIFTLGGATVGKLGFNFSWWASFGCLLALLAFVVMVIVFLILIYNQKKPD